MAAVTTEPKEQLMTSNEIIREFWRLCDLVTEAEKYEWVDEDGETHIGLLDMEHGQRMRDLYRERADVVLDYYKKLEKKDAPVFKLGLV